MGKGSRGKKKATLKYPKHAISPQDFLYFVELDEFVDDWERLGLDVEKDLWALQIAIMANPGGPPVVRGTGGLRKLKFAPEEWSRGKSGAARVCYVYFEDYAIVLLVAAYARNEKDELTAQEKKGIKQYISQAKQWLSAKGYK